MAQDTSGAPVIDLRTRRTYQPDYGAVARNRILMARSALGMDRAAFAAHLSAELGWPVTETAVEAWETSTVAPGDALMAATAITPPDDEQARIRSHKFVPAWLGAAVEDLPDQLAAEHPSGSATWHVWPCGVAVCHLVEDLTLPNLASLAMWRSPSYRRDLAWASDHLTATLTQPVQASYVLSVYWIDVPAWPGTLLDTAVRIAASPRVLLDRGITDPEERRRAAEAAERDLLAQGLATGDAHAFGTPSVSIGYASWSGVAYHPLDPGRALQEQELVDMELAVQSAWMFCQHVNDCTERGETPDVRDGYGARYLRGIRSALRTPRPQETNQHRAAREAIVETSGLPELLGQAMDALREAGNA